MQYLILVFCFVSFLFFLFVCMFVCLIVCLFCFKHNFQSYCPLLSAKSAFLIYFILMPINRSGLYGGSKCFFSCIILGTDFLYFIQPISTWNDKIFGLGSKKKVCSALLWHYTFFLWWEWIWVKNPLRTSFSGMLLWFCLIMCKWNLNTKFWNFHENRTLRFRKNLHFGSKFSGRALFTICRKFCFIRYFKVYSCR